MNRRELIKVCAGLGLWRGSKANAASLLDSTEKSEHVVIFGGGIAGLTAAHELAKRNFKVSLYESKSRFGGKARSIDVPNSASEGRKPLPGEHGFRFFPGFYQHIPETLADIPFGTGSVADNLVPTETVLFSRTELGDMEFPAGMPESLEDIFTILRATIGEGMGISRKELRYFANRLHVLLTSCQDRRDNEWESTDWWTFTGAAERSEHYQKLMAGLTRSLVAMRPHEGSTRTVGYILLQLLFSSVKRGSVLDSLLNGPTNDVWIDPWVDHCKSLGVEFFTEHNLETFKVENGIIKNATVSKPDKSQIKVEANHYICALPLETARPLLLKALPRDRSLAKLANLKQEWMVGVQLFLDIDVPINSGHAVFVDSNWALTTISQPQYWPDFPMEEYGDGKVRGLISIDVSDWNKPGELHRKTAKECNQTEIVEEIWYQLKKHLDEDSPIHNATILKSFIDPALRFLPNGKKEYDEPLLINTVNSVNSRPSVTTSAENLLIASDYIRTNTDLASMESANEAAKRAVNGILEKSRSNQPFCNIYEPREPIAFTLDRTIDQWRYRRGKKNIFDRT